MRSALIFPDYVIKNIAVTPEIVGDPVRAVVNVSGQYRYCLSYQDFCNNKWEELDNLHFTQRTKNEQMWWGGNVFTVTCDKGPIDKILKKQAFAVMYYDSIYVNCYNLWFQDDRFGKGYVKARRIGNRSLIFVNRTIGQEARGGQNMATFVMFGAIGAAIASASDSKRLMKQQVCYIISKGADEKGRIEIRMVNDDLISKMLNDNGEGSPQWCSRKPRSIMKPPAISSL